MARTPPRDLIQPWPTGEVVKGADPALGAAAQLVARIAHQLANARTTDRFVNQMSVSKKAKVSRHTLSRLEAGSTWADGAVLAKVCTALGLELDLVDAKTKKSVPLPGHESR